MIGGHIVHTYKMTPCTWMWEDYILPFVLPLIYAGPSWTCALLPSGFISSFNNFFAAGWGIVNMWCQYISTDLRRRSCIETLRQVHYLPYEYFFHLSRSFHEASRWARMVHHLQSVRNFPRTRDNIFVIQILLSPHCATQNLMVLLRIWQS